MCDPVTMTVVAVAVGSAVAAQGTVGAIGAEQSREAKKEYAKINARTQRGQVYANLQDQTEANAQKSFQLAQKALAARGVAQASNLGDRSVRAIGRAIGFELGQDQATIDKNQEIAQRTAAARLTGIDITLQSQKEQIGDTSGLQMGMEIAGAFIQGGMAAGQIIGAGGGFPTGAPDVGTTPTTTGTTQTTRKTILSPNALNDFMIA